jgi:RNA polymerase sigma-70 factor (ECF subfamily)
MESAAFRELALAELDSVHRMAYHLAGNQEDAADLVQETYLRALGAEDRFELREQGIRPWLFRILHNAFYTKLGKDRRAPALSENLQLEAGEGESEDGAPAWDLASLNWEQVDERLKEAIDELQPAYREVLLLWAVEGLKYKEIAEAVDVPLGTVMSRLYRARSILSGQLGDLAREMGIHVAE